MIPQREAQRVRDLWPLFERAGEREKVDARLLLAVDWEDSGLEGVDRRSIDRTASLLRAYVERFGLPRSGVAALLSSAEAVAAAGGVPREPAVQRRVRDVMFTWSWLIRNLSGLLGATVPGHSAHDQWLLQEKADGSGRIISGDVLAELELMAGHLGLIYARDEDERTVYIALPFERHFPAHSSRLAVPVLGAGPAHNGAFIGAEALDLLVPVGSPVVAVGDGKIAMIVIREAVWLHLDTPFVYHGRSYRYASVAGLGRIRPGLGDRVTQGEVLGWSGVTGRMPCVRFALSTDATGVDHVPAFALAGYFGWTS